jgi:hypothetical protein
VGARVVEPLTRVMCIVHLGLKWPLEGLKGRV